ncbi:MAG: hypothetical protein JXD21_04880 [Candidatus Omnitrophica bacterium]|nr:hypothetical protein [Candidatus Omnitrophota bacterium]
MQRKTVSTKSIKLLTFFVCVVCTAAFVAGGVYFYMEYMKVQEQLLPQRQRVGELQRDIGELDVFLRQYAADISRFEEILFQDKDIPLFLEGISSASDRFHAHIIEIKALSPQIVDIDGGRIRQSKQKIASRQQPSLQQDSLTLGSSPFRIKIKGSFENIIQFLLSLQEHRQLLSVSNVVIAEKEYPVLESSFDLDLYSLIKKGQNEVQP